MTSDRAASERMLCQKGGMNSHPALPFWASFALEHCLGWRHLSMGRSLELFHVAHLIGSSADHLETKCCWFEITSVFAITFFFHCVRVRYATQKCNKMMGVVYKPHLVQKNWMSILMHEKSVGPGNMKVDCPRFSALPSCKERGGVD